MGCSQLSVFPKPSTLILRLQEGFGQIQSRGRRSPPPPRLQLCLEACSEPMAPLKAHGDLHGWGSWADNGAACPELCSAGTLAMLLCGFFLRWSCIHHCFPSSCTLGPSSPNVGVAKWKQQGKEPFRASSYRGAKRGNVSRPWNQPCS